MFDWIGGRRTQQIDLRCNGLLETAAMASAALSPAHIRSNRSATTKTGVLTWSFLRVYAAATTENNVDTEVHVVASRKPRRVRPLGHVLNP